VTQFVFNTAFFILLAVFVPYAIRSLGLSASIVGVILGTFGVGMVVGALVAARIIRLLPFGMVVAIGPIAGLAAALVMVLTISIPSALLAGLSFFLLGAGPIVWVIGTTTLRQTVTPPDLLGRTVSAAIPSISRCATRNCALDQ
jgi:predicted MFS family arabinose efflux permease